MRGFPAHCYCQVLHILFLNVDLLYGLFYCIQHVHCTMVHTLLFYYRLDIFHVFLCTRVDFFFHFFPLQGPFLHLAILSAPFSVDPRCSTESEIYTLTIELNFNNNILISKSQINVLGITFDTKL